MDTVNIFTHTNTRFDCLSEHTSARQPDERVGWWVGVGGERVTRAYTVEVQTASVFYAQSLILLLFEP